MITKIKKLVSLLKSLRTLEHHFKVLETRASSQEIQTLIQLKYHHYLTSNYERLPNFSQVGFKAYSQFEEDGILLYIFSLIGAATQKVVEICAGDGRECMAANLIINHGWQGFLFDGAEQNVKSGQQFFAAHPQTFLMPPSFRQAWFTAENVNQILQDAGAVGEIDLLSLDIDGMDYWVWQAIDIIQPRVCVFETHNIIPADLSLTAKYDPNFYYLNQPPDQQDYRGASLLAMTKLSQNKGYRLIGAHRHGFNCFFMRNDIGQDHFPEVSVQSCHDNPYTKLAQTTRWPVVQHLDWQEI